MFDYRIGRVSKQRRHIQRLAVGARRPTPAADDAEAVVRDAEGAPLSAADDILEAEDEGWNAEPFPASSAVSDNSALDGWLKEMPDNQIAEISKHCWLQWKDGAGSQLRKAHNGTGRSKFFARQAEKRRMTDSMSGYKNILHFFAPKKAAEDGETNDERSTLDADVPEKSIRAAIVKLRKLVQIKDNARLEKRRESSQFDFIRRICISRYLEKIEQNPRTRIKSSIEVAAIVSGKARTRDLTI